MKRRKFLAFFAVGASTSLSGCLTKKLLDDPNSTSIRNYVETVSEFLITPDAKKLVVLGKDYHYILDAPADLVKTLQSSFRSSISAEFSTFHVTDNRVSGHFQLKVDATASNNVKAAARKIGFASIQDGGMILRGKLTGTRYSAANFNAAAVKSKFNRNYQIHVQETVRTGPGLKILLTPVTVTADGVLLVIGAVSLVLLLIPICIASRGTCSAGG